MKNYSEINKVFTRNSLKRLIDIGTSDSYEYCIKHFIEPSSPIKNIDIFQMLYKILDDKYRNEYYYKNTLFNKLLLGTHSLNTSIAISELPIHKSKADFILINGIAEVFEIKTELDNLERLPSQIEDYYKIFSYVSILTSETNYYKVYQLFKGSDVGIKILTRRNTISVKKKPIFNNHFLDPISMFKVLRKHEFEDILQRKTGELPKVNQFEYYKECKKLFLDIPKSELQIEVQKQLKQRNIMNEKNFKNLVPLELRSLAYFSNYSENEFSKLQQFLKTERR